MSVGATIEIRCQPFAQDSILSLIDVLLANGWTMDNGFGHIQYFENSVEDPIRAEDFVKPIGRAEEVLARLMVLSVEKRVYSLLLRNVSDNVGVLVGPSLDGDKSKLIFGTFVDRKHAAWSERWIDHNWYLERLVPVIERAGFTILTIRFNEG